MNFLLTFHLLDSLSLIHYHSLSIITHWLETLLYTLEMLLYNISSSFPQNITTNGNKCIGFFGYWSKTLIAKGKKCTCKCTKNVQGGINFEHFTNSDIQIHHSLFSVTDLNFLQSSHSTDWGWKRSRNINLPIKAMSVSCLFEESVFGQSFGIHYWTWRF